MNCVTFVQYLPYLPSKLFVFFEKIAKTGNQVFSSIFAKLVAGIMFFSLKISIFLPNSSDFTLFSHQMRMYIFEFEDFSKFL